MSLTWSLSGQCYRSSRLTGPSRDRLAISGRVVSVSWTCACRTEYFTHTEPRSRYRIVLAWQMSYVIIIHACLGAKKPDTPWRQESLSKKTWPASVTITVPRPSR